MLTSDDCGGVVRGGRSFICLSDIDGTIVHYPDTLDKLGTFRESSDAKHPTGLEFVDKV